MLIPCFPKSRYQIQSFYRTENTVCGKDGERIRPQLERRDRCGQYDGEARLGSRQRLNPVIREESFPNSPFPTKSRKPAPSFSTLSKVDPRIFLVSRR